MRPAFVAAAVALARGRRLRRPAAGRRRRRRSHRRGHRRPQPAAGARAGACRSRATARTARSCACRACRRSRAARSTRPGSSATAWSSPSRRSRWARDGGGAVAVPDDLVGRRGGARHARAARRRAARRARTRSSRSSSKPQPPLQLAFPARGDLLPPPRPRDRRALLELRAADLPRLHDHHVGRHALPGVRAPAHAGDARHRGRPRPTRVLTYVLIGISVVALHRPGRPAAGRARPGSATAAAPARAPCRGVDGGRRRVLAPDHRGLPARRPVPPARSTCSPSTSSAGCSSRRSASCASG